MDSAAKSAPNPDDLFPMMDDEQALVAGVDEAGRGPLAGPVLAAAVILDPCRPIEGLADSKQLSPQRRCLLADLIRRDARAWSLGSASIEEIDEINILQASLVAMGRAVVNLALSPTRVLVDGLHCPTLPIMTRAIVRGDARVPAISAASILAKVARDEIMAGLHGQFPQYGFDTNKGYPTKGHLLALRAVGPCAAHRRSFRPVRAALGEG